MTSGFLVDFIFNLLLSLSPYLVWQEKLSFAFLQLLWKWMNHSGTEWYSKKYLKKSWRLHHRMVNQADCTSNTRGKGEHQGVKGWKHQYRLQFRDNIYYVIMLTLWPLVETVQNMRLCFPLSSKLFGYLKLLSRNIWVQHSIMCHRSNESKNIWEKVRGLGYDLTFLHIIWKKYMEKISINYLLPVSCILGKSKPMW